jgi:hypothetical protein
VCALWRAQEGQDAKSWSDSDDWDCDYFADKFRFVELPCKVGDKIWIFVYPNHPPCEARVRSIFISNNSVELNFAIKGYFAQTANVREFGETIFLTSEEAEAALAERMKENG